MSNLNNMSDSKDLRSALSENISEEEQHITSSDDRQEQKQPQEDVKEKSETNQPETVEAFAERVDTRGKTPEELEEIYRNYNKAYTQKRQKEKEELRMRDERISQLEQKLQGIEKQGNAIQDPELQQQRQDVQKQYDMGNLTVEEYTKQMRELIKEDARSIAKEVFADEYRTREEESTQGVLLEKFNSIDGRFSKEFIDPESPEFNKTNAWLYQQVAGRMADELQAHIDRNGSSKGFNVEEVAKKHISEIDSYIDAVVKSRVQRSATQQVQKAQEFQRSNPRGVTTPSQSTAKKGLRSLLEEVAG